MTKEQVENLKLGIAPIDEKTVILIESGLHWVLKNTTLTFDTNDDEDLKALHPNVRLFLIHYFDIMSMTPGISSESISGLSQSYDTTDKSTLIWQYAYELLGDWLKSQMSFYQAKSRW
jgi:hypothetical protein